MKKAGDIRKRRLLLALVGAIMVSAEMKTVDSAKALAAEPARGLNLNKMVATVEEVEESSKEEKTPPISTIQEEVVLGKIEESLSIVERDWSLILSGTCEDTTSLELEIEAQLSEAEKLREEIATTSYEQEISSARADFEALKSCREKLANVQITEGSDMSTVIGLNEREVKYLLLSVKKETGGHLTTDENVAKELATGIVQGAEMYQVNELFAIGVIMWESGWLTGDNALLYNNVGNTKRTDKDEFRVYDTLEAGMLATVSAIRNNMKGNNTSSDIAPTYCCETTEANEKWAKSTVSLARKCLNVAK